MAKPGTVQRPIFPVAAVEAAIQALHDALAQAGDRPAVDPFHEALAAIRPAAAVAPPRQEVPVCGHLVAALDAARGTPAAAFVEPVAALAGAAFWTQNPNYRSRPPAPDFLDRYGYFVLAGPADGPSSFIECPDLACGFLLLAPGTLYPSHRHPAVELYIPLSGDGEWQEGANPWRKEQPGAVIHNPSGVAHAMRAGTAPLLAAYLWLGELATHARLAQA